MFYTNKDIAAYQYAVAALPLAAQVRKTKLAELLAGRPCLRVAELNS